MKHRAWAFIIALCLAGGWIAACNIENPFFEPLKDDGGYSQGITFAGHQAISRSEAWSDGTIVLPPQSELTEFGEERSRIRLTLVNPFEFTLTADLNDPLRKATWVKVSPTEIVIAIDHAALDDTFDLTLALTDLNGPKKTHVYTLPTIRCLSFNTDLIKVVADNGTIRRETNAAINAEATIRVPYLVENVSLSGIPADINATLRGAVYQRELSVGLNEPASLTVIAQNRVTTADHSVRIFRATSYVDFRNGVFSIIFYEPDAHEELVDLSSEGLTQGALSWSANDRLCITIDHYNPDYTYEWYINDRLSAVSGLPWVFEKDANDMDFDPGSNRVTCKVLTDEGELYSSQAVQFTIVPSI
ncbi:MAG: hypothetical protein LBS86_03105 [Treponema sp.]|jgi:hypothetical protein|nr:hypothetical protein [Treponema sp.]